MSKIESKTVVRVATSYWYSGKSVYYKRSITQLARKSVGYNLIEDMLSCDISESVNDVINLHEVSDGIYELVMVDLDYDWETGYLDNWCYKLVPYKDDNES